MPQIGNGRWQAPDFPLLNGHGRNTEQCGYLFTTDEDVIVEAAKMFKKLEISIHNQRSCHMSDENRGIHWSFLRGEITSPSALARQELEILAFALGTVIDDYDKNGVLRIRDALPLVTGIEIARLLRRICCYKAKKFGNRFCRFWEPKVIERGVIRPWDTTCKVCPKPSVNLEMVYAIAFPPSPEEMQPLDEPVADDSVQPDRFRAWTAGREPMPIEMARKANDALEYRGWKTPEEGELMRQLLVAFDRLHQDLRPLKRMLLRNWRGLLARQQAVAVTWRPGGSDPSWRFLPVDPDDGLRPLAPGIYPSAEGMEAYDVAGSYSFNREVRSFQRKPMSYQIRLTRYPLPIDKVADEQEAGWAVRLLIRPLGT